VARDKIYRLKPQFVIRGMMIMNKKLPEWINFYSIYSLIVFLLIAALNLYMFFFCIDWNCPFWSDSALAMMFFLLPLLVSLILSIVSLPIAFLISRSKTLLWLWWILNLPLLALNAYIIFLFLVNL
jgi:hypothetical protein